MNKKVIIIGSGPAGYSAAIYLSRAKLSPMLITGNEMGGQPMYTTEIENYPGFSKGVMGGQLMSEMKAQAEKFGTEIIFGNVNRVDLANRGDFRVWTDDNEYVCESVIIATGSESIRLNLTNEDRLFGKGISVCAVCDGSFYQDKVTYVVGGGDTACEDSLALTKFAKEVYLVVRRDELRASKIMQDKVKNNEKIRILWNTQVVAMEGEDKLERISLLNNKTNEEKEVQADGLFYAIGRKPHSKVFDKQIEIDEKGYIMNSLWCRVGVKGEGKFSMMTSQEGVFAAGDVVDHKYRQVAVSVGMGVMAALDCEGWLEGRG